MISKTSLGDYINLDPDDVPSIEELEIAAETLKKCAKLYGEMRGRKDPPPEPLDMAASFLETLVLKHKKQLRKKPIGGK